MNQISFRRYASKASISLIQDTHEYLRHCRFHGLSTVSTVFQGTLYELYVKQFLTRHLNAKGLIKCGGAYDNGVDLMGKWDLMPYYKVSEALGTISRANECSLIHSQGFQNTPLETKLSLKNDINLLVQCKNYRKKLSASTVRQLAGILEYHQLSLLSKASTFMFIVSPHGITEQATTVLDKLLYPLASIGIAPLRNTGNSEQLYDYDSWCGGELNSIYLNQMARQVLSGFCMEQQLSLLVASGLGKRH